jgi:calmodulin
MNPEEGKKVVKSIVDEWSQIYINQVFYIQSFNNVHHYYVEFSRPHKTKPIPESTVKVYFYVVETTDDDKVDPDKPYRIEFNFESESLRHTMDKTMRKNMFEKWIDRVLEKKSKIKELLHLGTDFEYTRMVDEQGKIVDPFVPKFDITKAKDFNKEVTKSQKVRIESPRFIRTLRKALYEIFYEADKDHSGYLDYDEFKNSFKNLSYGLNENDIYTLIALADENDDGKITWEEFIPIGIEAIKTFYARNKTLQKMKDFTRDLDKEALESIYYPEINKAWEILEKEFKKQDIQNDGNVTIFQLKKVLKSTNLVTPKELNALVRNCQVDSYEYKNFCKDLFDVRFELAKSRISESNMNFMQKSLVEECKKYDTTSNGKIHITQMREVLRNSKFVALSPFQIHIVLGQSELDDNKCINYQKFTFRVKEMIDNVFSVDALSHAADLVKEGTVKEDDIEQTYISNLDLFKIFKKYDKNMNGYLELDEYMECLTTQELNLTKQEMIALALDADVDGNGKIDYEEFMKHFKSVLEMVRFQGLLNSVSIEHMEKKKEERLAKIKEEEEKRNQED